MNGRAPASKKVRLTIAMILIVGLIVFTAPDPVYTLKVRVTDKSIESIRVLLSDTSEHAYVQFGTVPNEHEFVLPRNEYTLSIQRRSNETEHQRIVLDHDMTVDY